MDRKHLIELHEKESSYWWHVNKRRIVMELLGGCVGPGGAVLEVGCGGGYLSAALVKEGRRQVAADISYDAVRFARERGALDAMVFDASRAWPLAAASFDAVLMLDVLEHLDEDARALAEARRVLRDGGVLIATVPAHQGLFSEWDRLVGHRRRYARGQLAAAARAAGLRPLRITAWNLVSFVPAVLLRTRDRLFGSRQTFAEFPAVPAAVNTCLKWAGRLESRLCRRVNLRLGLSFAAVLEKD
ncbi:MAG: class I SAM-dependent methyltransferase [Phycisphaerae bacterium]|nr:class I SAM-dependent methyltransferase [Phycisphaerae bacterium]